MKSPPESFAHALFTQIFISVCLLLSIASVEAESLVLPAKFKSVEGNDGEGTSLGFFSNTAQVVYGASLVGAAGINIGDRISGLSFRLDSPSPAPVWSVADYQIRLATSLNGPGNLDRNFVNNRGADYTVVRTGPLTYKGTEYPVGGSPNGFGQVISFTTSFTYTGGDLLLEYTHSPISEGGVFADAEWSTEPLAQAQFSAGFDSTMESFGGDGRNGAVIVQFEIQETTLDDCDNDFVDLDNRELIIRVTPTGIDDTANIQCALDSAANIGIPIVSLSAGDFFIRNVFVERFNGSFQGTTRASTRLNIIDNSIDCALLEGQGLTPAAIKFGQGEPQFKFMQVLANSPCMTDVPLDILIHFTGKNANEPACGFSVINGRVDRVDVLGPGPLGNVTHGIAATAEAELLGGCNDALLGGFKLNKSSVSDFTIGLLTSMRSGAQVDVNFNNFEQNMFGLVISDSNQITTVTGNVFISDDTVPIIENSSVINANLDDSAGVLVITDTAMPPAKTKLEIDNNKFTISSAMNQFRDAIRVATFESESQVVSLAVTNNVFTLSGTDTAGVWVDNVSNANIATNRFNGSGFSGIGVVSRFLPSVSNSTITGNTGFETFNDPATGTDIIIESGVMQTYVGAGQGAVVLDNGMGSVLMSNIPVDENAGLQANSNGTMLDNVTTNASHKIHAMKDSLERLNKLRRKN